MYLYYSRTFIPFSLIHSLSRSFYLSRGTFTTRHHPSSIHRKKMMTMRPPRSREVGQPIAAATTQRRRKNGTSFHRKKMMTMLPPRSREVGRPIAAVTTQRRQKNAKKNKDDDDHKNCSIMSFEGDYVFAKGCDGNSYHITISKHCMGYVYEGKPLYDGDSGKILNCFRIIVISRNTY